MCMLLPLLACSAFFYVNEPAVTMYDKPDPESAIVSDLYFSEEVTKLDESGDWARVRLSSDGYTGWVQTHAIIERDSPYPSVPEDRVARVDVSRIHLYQTQDTEKGPKLTLPRECVLEIVEPTDGSSCRFLKVRLPDDRELFVHSGDVSVGPRKLLSLQALARWSEHECSDTPYLWGGRTSFGYDCSGFTQMLYRQMGVAIPRDSKRQFSWEGFQPAAFETLAIGDLIFFGPAEGTVCHVAMYVGGGKFIHANAGKNEFKSRVIISSLDAPAWNGSGRLTFRAARTLRPDLKESIPRE